MIQGQPQTICSARCVHAWAGPVPLAQDTVPVPVLELEFLTEHNHAIRRRFLLDQKHPQRLQGFLEGFLGHPIAKLWELDPETLVGRQGPLLPPESEAHLLPSGPV